MKHLQPKNFYPRPPRGGRHTILLRFVNSFFISIHALREEGDAILIGDAHESGRISIHALREEGDPVPRPICVWLMISIHALREEGDGQKRKGRKR